jgi:hypothetical protein
VLRVLSRADRMPTQSRHGDQNSDVGHQDLAASEHRFGPLMKIADLPPCSTTASAGWQRA